jgi:hypothetical protein
MTTKPSGGDAGPRVTSSTGQVDRSNSEQSWKPFELGSQPVIRRAKAYRAKSAWVESGHKPRHALAAQSAGAVMKAFPAFLTSPIPAAILGATVSWASGGYPRPVSVAVFYLLLLYGAQLVFGIAIRAYLLRSNRQSAASFALGGTAMTGVPAIAYLARLPSSDPGGRGEAERGRSCSGRRPIRRPRRADRCGQPAGFAPRRALHPDILPALVRNARQRRDRAYAGCAASERAGECPSRQASCCRFGRASRRSG